MEHLRLLAAGLLLLGLGLAVGTPGYIARAAPRLSGYLIHPEIFLWQAAPYLLCAALWLPWRAPAAQRTAVVLSGLLLLTACLVYVPMLLDAGSSGGDMAGLSFVLVSVVTTIVLLVVSGLVVIVLWQRNRKPAAT